MIGTENAPNICNWAAWDLLGGLAGPTSRWAATIREGAQGPLAREGGLHLDICARVTEFLVTPLLMEPVCLLSQRQFEKPVTKNPSTIYNRCSAASNDQLFMLCTSLQRTVNFVLQSATKKLLHDYAVRSLVETGSVTITTESSTDGATVLSRR